MSQHWYVVHAYSGFEQQVKKMLHERIKRGGLDDSFGEILVPTEEVVEMRDGQRRKSDRKFFPGYILVHMDLDDETWHVVKGTPKITGFVGNATDPPIVSEDEVERMTQRMKEGESKPKPLINFEEGEVVRVVTGPFANFSGFVDEVLEDKEKLRVMVQVFGRATPVVLDYGNVEKS